MCNKNMSCLTGNCGCMNNLGLLMLRIAIGVPFIVHGVAKLMNIAGTTGFFNMIGLPSVMVYVVGILEVLAGLMIVLGLWAAIGGWIVSIIMAGAYLIVKHKMPFFSGWELDMILFFSGLAIAMVGSGKYSIKKDACCSTCTTNSQTMSPNTCTHMNCKCGDCTKCQ
jgi:putative oxidoreductase